MTDMLSLFTSYSVNSSKDKVRIANDYLFIFIFMARQRFLSPMINVYHLCYMFLSSLLTCYPLVTLLKILTIVLPFSHLVVCFRTWC